MINKSSVRRKSASIFREVIKLRKLGHSYSEIGKKTGVAKSTINNWLTLAGLTLSKEHLQIQAKKRVENHVIATLASKITRAKRKDEEIQSFIQKVKKYLNDPFFIAGIMLYEAEGSKGNNNGFSNSDFRLISVFIKFLEKYLSLDKKVNMSFRVYVHEIRKNDLLKIKNFWAKKLSIGKDIIRVSWKHNQVTERRLNKDYVGQLNVHVENVKHFTGKLLAISDIILTKYQR